jgi:hypothetical protein
MDCASVVADFRFVLFFSPFTERGTNGWVDSPLGSRLEEESS